VAAIIIVVFLLDFYINILHNPNNSLVYNKLIDEDVEGLVENKQTTLISPKLLHYQTGSSVLLQPNSNIN
jgi:hypothetical protein